MCSIQARVESIQVRVESQVKAEHLPFFIMVQALQIYRSLGLRLRAGLLEDRVSSTSNFLWAESFLAHCHSEDLHCPLAAKSITTERSDTSAASLPIKLPDRNRNVIRYCAARSSENICKTCCAVPCPMSGSLFPSPRSLCGSDCQCEAFS